MKMSYSKQLLAKQLAGKKKKKKMKKQDEPNPVETQQEMLNLLFQLINLSGKGVVNVINSEEDSEWLKIHLDSDNPKADITAQQIEQHELFNKRTPEERHVLRIILRSCAARIYFNEVLVKFYQNETAEGLAQHFKRTYPKKYIDEASDEALQLHAIFAKQSLPSFTEEDVKFYLHIMKIIHDNLGHPKLFERIERMLAKKIWEATEDEKRTPELLLQEENEQAKENNGNLGLALTKVDPKVRAARLLVRGYIESQEYADGRELPYVQDMMDTILPVLSKRYKTYIQYNTFFGPRKGHGTAALVACKNDQYYKTLESDFNTLQRMVDGLLNSKHNLSTNEIETLLNASSINQAYVQCKQNLESRKDLASYDITVQKFNAVYDLDVRIKVALVKIKMLESQILNKHLAAKNNSKEDLNNTKEELNNSKNNLEKITQADNEKENEKKLSGDSKQKNATNTTNMKNTANAANVANATMEVVPFHYFDYKNALVDQKEMNDKPQGMRTRRLSKDDSAILSLVLSKDETEIPHFGIKRNELDKLFKSLGGRVISKGGSKLRYELNNLWGDMPSFVGTLPQHSNHGQDNRNDFVSKYTVMQFRSLMQRAGIDLSLGLVNSNANAAKTSC